ncbi:MAG: hypothetical protein AB1758_21240 [Candidatus Eremiobacterota bacterium]
MQSSSSFYARVDVLFRAPIVKGEGWTFQEKTPLVVGQADVIDLNGNGKADTIRLRSGKPEDRYAPNGDAPIQELYTEPVLSRPLEDYRAVADGEGIVHQGLVSDVIIRNGGIIWSGQEGTGWGEGERFLAEGTEVLDLGSPKVGLGCPRSISTLVAELGPVNAGARWALDLNSREFVIFTPRSRWIL